MQKSNAVIKIVAKASNLRLFTFAKFKIKPSSLPNHIATRCLIICYIKLSYIDAYGSDNLACSRVAIIIFLQTSNVFLYLKHCIFTHFLLQY